jgi:hypothetical protein
MVFTMYPSYPSYRRHADLAIQFSVPNKDMVKRILSHRSQDIHLRQKAAGNVLHNRVGKLASVLSRHRIQIKKLNSNELGVILFLPPPPCPKPNLHLIPQKKRNFKPQLATIFESQDNGHENLASQLEEEQWITLYEYLPRQGKRALHSCDSLKDLGTCNCI